MSSKAHQAAEKTATVATAAQPPTLDYAADAQAYERKRHVRRALRWLLIVLVLGVGILVAARVTRNLIQIRQEDALVAKSIAPGTVVLTDDKAASPERPDKTFVEDLWPLQRQHEGGAYLNDLNKPATLLIAHMRAPSGTPLFMFATADKSVWARDQSVRFVIRVHCFSAATPTRSRQFLNDVTLVLTPPAKSIRIAAARLDANDSTHATVDFWLDDQLGTCDIWTTNKPISPVHLQIRKPHPQLDSAGGN